MKTSAVLVLLMLVAAFNTGCVSVKPVRIDTNFGTIKPSLGGLSVKVRL